MKYSTDLLFRLLRVTGTGVPEGGDREVEIPTALFPVVTAIGPLPSATSSPPTALRRETFLVSLGNTLPASTAQADTLVVTLSRGLWRVSLAFMHHANFTEGPGNFDGLLRIQDPDNVASTLVQLPNVASVPLVVRSDFDVILERDSWQIRILQTATGVGQSMFSNVSGVISRLL